MLLSELPAAKSIGTAAKGPVLVALLKRATGGSLKPFSYAAWVTDVPETCRVLSQDPIRSLAGMELLPEPRDSIAIAQEFFDPDFLRGVTYPQYNTPYGMAGAWDVSKADIDGYTIVIVKAVFIPNT